MKKLKLNLDQIQVVSFTVETTQGNGGTVEGHSANTDDTWRSDRPWSCRICLPDDTYHTTC